MTLLQLPPDDPVRLACFSHVCKPWRRLLTDPPPSSAAFARSTGRGSALRSGGCNHLDCHGGPFRVVFVCTDDEGVTFARVYSSEAATWSCKTSIEHHDATVSVDTGTSVLVGNTLYFPCNPSTRIVEYDFDDGICAQEQRVS